MAQLLSESPLATLGNSSICEVVQFLAVVAEGILVSIKLDFQKFLHKEDEVEDEMKQT
jgi:hypothetical protein